MLTHPNSAELPRIEDWPTPTIAPPGHRNVRSTILSPIFRIGLIIGGLIFSSLWGMNFDREFTKLSALETKGVVTSATVIRYFAEDDDLRAELRYKWDSRTYRQEVSVPRWYQEDYPVEGTMQLTVLPSNPEVIVLGKLEPGEAKRRIAGNVVFGILFTSMFGVAVLWVRHLTREHVQFLSEWPAVAGIVTRITRSDDGVRITVHYVIDGSIRNQEIDLLQNASKGDRVDLLYNPKFPADVRPVKNLLFADLRDDKNPPPG